MPGHKLSREKSSLVLPQEFTQDLLQLDVTEIEGTDNLHYPEGIIKEAQELAARAFGADRTFFLVNGSTCGIQAAIMSVCARGQKIIISRDAHKSVVSGLILSGAEPVFVYPEYNDEFGIAEAINPGSIEKALQENPDATSVLITRPNYYGICSDIEEIVKVVHSYNKILIVDEAHGAHLAFSPLLPTPALRSGADLCIQSAHKTLPAVTQSAYLHIKGNRIDIEKLKFNLAMLQTSSPSYIIMSYLDIAREIMETEGSKKLEELIKNVEVLKQQIKENNIYKVLSAEHLGINILQDTTRIVVNISNLGITGYRAEQILRDCFNTQAEMSENVNLVFIATIADNAENLAKLAKAMKALANMHSQNDSYEISYTCKYTKHHSSSITPADAYAAQKEQISLSESNGRICANIITPYPPGIPVIYPGEIIDNQTIEYITSIVDIGGKVNGIEGDRNVWVLR
jgi:arginine decarboxylase